MRDSAVLSVLITAHNCATWLDATLESVIAAIAGADDQCEVIIINDASEDETQQIIDAFTVRYPRLTSDNTALRNIGKVRNHAINLAQGDYVLMVDGDDRLLPGAIADHLKVLTQQQPALYLSKIIECRTETPAANWQFSSPNQLTTHSAIQKFLIHREFQAHVIGQYFRRTLLLANPFPPFVCYEDTWLFPLLLTQAEKILYTDAGFYLYRKHSNSLSTVMNDEKVDCMVAATRHLDEVLPVEFQPLIVCHWLDVAHRHRDVLQRTGHWQEVVERILATRLMRFMLNSAVRTSYKRKMLAFRKGIR